MLSVFSLPNGGIDDFSAKYEAIDVGTLYAMIRPLNHLMDEEVRRSADVWFALGRFVERDPSALQLPSDQLSKANVYYDKPMGLGRVWPVSRVIDAHTDYPRLQIAYLTEMEHPHIFAHIFAMQDEYAYVANLWRAREEAIAGSLVPQK